MTEFDDKGKPTDLPVRLKRAAWLATFQVLSRTHEVLRAMQDRAVASCKACPHCGLDIQSFGDPQAAKLVLDYERRAREDYKKETGNAAPGDLAALFADIKMEDFQEVMLLAAELQSSKRLPSGSATPDNGSPHP